MGTLAKVKSPNTKGNDPQVAVQVNITQEMLRDDKSYERLMRLVTIANIGGWIACPDCTGTAISKESLEKLAEALTKLAERSVPDTELTKAVVNLANRMPPLVNVTVPPIKVEMDKIPVDVSVKVAPETLKLVVDPASLDVRFSPDPVTIALNQPSCIACTSDANTGKLCKSEPPKPPRKLCHHADHADDREETAKNPFAFASRSKAGRKPNIEAAGNN
jgi:hypothetical protein